MNKYLVKSNVIKSRFLHIKICTVNKEKNKIKTVAQDLQILWKKVLI